MNGEPSQASQAIKGSVLSRAVPLVRVLFAWVLTTVGLPYLWGRSFIGWQLTGRPERFYAAMLGIVVVVIVVLTWRLGELPLFRTKIKLIGLAVAGSWIALNVAMFCLRVGTLIPRAIVIAAYVPGSLFVPGIAWLSFFPSSRRTRLSVVALLLGMLIGFLTVFRVEGLSGDSNVNFCWRFAAARIVRPAGFVGAAKQAESVGAALIGNPDRDYTQFLGPDRNAVLPHARLGRDWASHPPRELWRKPIGQGWSSFAVVGDFAFTQEQRGEEECVVCYRLLTGEQVWLHSDPGHFTSSLGGPGPRATPTVHENRVYSVGAAGLLNCLEALTGRTIWSLDILRDNGAENIAHGVCASPLLLGDWVLVCPTGSQGPSLVAYYCETGERVWQAGPDGASYSSPAVTELAGVRQVLLFNSAGLTGHDATTGEPLWHFPWTNAVKTNASQPIAHAGGADQVFISTGYDKGSALIRVDRSADAAWRVQTIWSNNRLKTKFCSAVVHGGYVYGLDDGIFACRDLATGTRGWKQGRYGHGQILLAGDLLIILAEAGDVMLVEPNPHEFRELGRFHALDGKTWNNPALAGPYLIVRNDREAACYELPPADEPAPSREVAPHD